MPGLLGTAASVIIVTVVVGVACYHAAQIPLANAPTPPMQLPLLGSGFTMAVGIFILSLGGHAALPSIYASMAEVVCRLHTDCMLMSR